MAVSSSEGTFIGLGVISAIALVAAIFQFSAQSSREKQMEISAFKEIDRIFNDMEGGRRTRKSKSGNKKTKRRS